MKTKPKLSYTLGGDPEFLLLDREEGRIVSSIPILKRDKNNPIELGDGIKFYYDNAPCELAFPPSDTREGMVETLRKAFVRAHEKLGPRYQLEAKAAHVYDPDQLNHPAALEVGCSPNFNVYTRSANPPADFKGGLRSGSCHIHIGSDRLMEMSDKETAVKLLDIFLGCSSVLFDMDETSLDRRKLYGRAGEFRPTPYGIEARILGNYALRSPKLMHFVLSLVDQAMMHITGGTAQEVLEACDEPTTIDAINHNNRLYAIKSLKKAGLSEAVITRCISSEFNGLNLQKEWGIA